jgi:hypothetical protein
MAKYLVGVKPRGARLAQPIDQLTAILDKPDVRVFAARDGEFKDITE